MEQLINALDLLDDIEMLEGIEAHNHHPDMDVLDEINFLEEIEILEDDQNTHPIKQRRYWVHPINVKRDDFGFFNNLLTEMRQHGNFFFFFFVCYLSITIYRRPILQLH